MRLYLLLLFLVLIAVNVSAVEIDLPGSYLNRTGTIGKYPQLDIIGLKYEPFPVEPAEYFTLWIRVQNLGNDDATNAIVELIEKEPFSIDDPNIREIGKLGSRQEMVLKFERIKASENAIEGTNKLEFRLNPGGAYQELTRIKKIDIDIESVSPVLQIDISSEPERIPQGGTSTVIIAVKNTGNSLIEDITLKLNLPDEIAPIGTTTEKKIDKLKKDEQKILNFDLIALADASAKAYKVGLNVTYYDKIGNKFTKDDVIGLLVGSSVDYDVNLEESDLFEKNTKGKITLSVSNIGASEIKFMNMQLEDTEDYLAIGKRKAYLGNLESDDFETAEFEIFVKSKGDVPLKLTLEYKDNYNNKYEETQNILLKVYSGRELRKYGLAEKRNFLNIILGIILVILIYWTWKFWRKERDLVKAIKLSLKEFLLGIAGILSKLRWRYIKRIPRKIRFFFQYR